MMARLHVGHGEILAFAQDRVNLPKDKADEYRAALLEAVAAGRTEIERRDVQLLERGFDRLHQLLTRTGDHRVVEPAQDLVDAFEVRTTTDIAAAAGAAGCRAAELRGFLLRLFDIVRRPCRAD